MNSRIRSPRVDPQISPFLIDGLELTLRPVQKYPQVIAVHSHLPANAVLILFFEEHSPQQVPVPSRQGGKDLPHVLGELLGHHHRSEERRVGKECIYRWSQYDIETKSKRQ